MSPTDSDHHTTGTIRLVGPALVLLLAMLVATSEAESAGFGGAEAVGNLLYYAIVAWWVLRVGDYYGVDLASRLQPPAASRAWLLALTALPLLVITVSTSILLVVIVAKAAPDVAERILAPELPEPSPPWHWALLLHLGGAMLAPAVEELLFRGVLLQTWTRRHGPRVAAIGTSMLFAVVHLDPIGAFIFGLTMVGIYRRTGSLLVPIAAHMLNNAITMVVGAGPDTEGGSIAELDGLAVAASLALVGGFTFLWTLLSRRVIGVSRFSSEMSR